MTPTITSSMKNQTFHDMTKETKKKAQVKPKHPRNGGTSRFKLWVSFSDKDNAIKLSIPFPDDYQRELSVLKERYRKLWRGTTTRAAHIYDTSTGNILEYLSREMEWKPSKPALSYEFKIVIQSKEQIESKVFYFDNKESMSAKMTLIAQQGLHSQASNIYVYDRQSMIYYWNFRHSAFEVPYQKQQLVPFKKSKYRLFVIDENNKMATSYSSEPDDEQALIEIMQKLELTDFSKCRVVQVYEQDQNSLLFHAKYGHTVLNVLEAYQNAISSS